MPESQEYNQPPITEAIIDLRVVPCPNLSLGTLKQLSEESDKEYPNIKPMIEATGTIHVEPGVGTSASAKHKQTGYRATSTDGKYVCQRQLEGFTFSRLAPYKGWKSFRNLAKTMWNAYRIVAPQSVTRIAARYINRIDIPIPTNGQPIELKDYFRTGPEISPELPQAISGFFMQVHLPQDDISAQVIINQAIVPPPNPDIISVILDIDLFRDHSLPDSEEAIWNHIEEFHDRKNSLFESCITDSTRGLFN